MVGLHKNGVSNIRLVHRVVLETFIGPPPDKTMACHRDGNRRNNRLENLYWGTSQENQQDRIKHGTDSRGEKSGRSKLTTWQVMQIKGMVKSGEFSYLEIGRIFRVSSATVSSIVNGRTWSHI